MLPLFAFSTCTLDINKRHGPSTVYSVLNWMYSVWSFKSQLHDICHGSLYAFIREIPSSVDGQTVWALTNARGSQSANFDRHYLRRDESASIR